MAEPLPAREPEEWAALYVSGALTPSEREELEAEFATGNEHLVRETARLDEVARALAAMVGPIEPSPETRDAILGLTGVTPRPDAAAKQVWRDWSSDPANAGSLFTLGALDSEWEPTGVDGIEVRRLFVDREHNRMTALFRMAAGSAYVPHVHDGPEECYVLEGDLRVGDDLVLRAGDYQRAPAGSTHGVQRTENGCLLLISSSLDDEWV